MIAAMLAVIFNTRRSRFVLGDCGMWSIRYCKYVEMQPHESGPLLNNVLIDSASRFICHLSFPLLSLLTDSYYFHLAAHPPSSLCLSVLYLLSPCCVCRNASCHCILSCGSHETIFVALSTRCPFNSLGAPSPPRRLLSINNLICLSWSVGLFSLVSSSLSFTSDLLCHCHSFVHVSLVTV